MKICDAHNDFLTELKNNKSRIDHIKQINKNKNIKKICAVIWTSKLKNPIRFINNISKNVLNKVKSKKLLICIEDLGFINKNNLDFCIDYLKKLKPFYCGLTWNNNNNLGGGAFGKKGLTNLGKKVITELENNNILIDTAHMNKRTFNDFAKITKKPIFNSHSNLNKLFNHVRNLNNNQINKICRSKGLFCLSFVKSFISINQINSCDIAKQIQYFLNNFNKNSLALGTDFYGTKKLPNNLICYNDFKNLKNDLLKIGVDKKITNKIFYKNFLNFYKFIKKFK